MNSRLRIICHPSSFGIDTDIWCEAENVKGERHVLLSSCTVRMSALKVFINCTLPQVLQASMKCVYAGLPNRIAFRVKPPTAIGMTKWSKAAQLRVAQMGQVAVAEKRLNYLAILLFLPAA